MEKQTCRKVIKTVLIHCECNGSMERTCYISFIESILCVGVCFIVFSGSSTLVILELFEVQNCTYALEVFLWMEAFPWFDWFHILTQCRSFELALQCHRFEVHLVVRSKVTLVLLKSGTSASREEAVEDMKKCRSTLRPWCCSTLMPKDETSLFDDWLKPRNHHTLQECP